MITTESMIVLSDADNTDKDSSLFSSIREVVERRNPGDTLCFELGKVTKLDPAFAFRCLGDIAVLIQEGRKSGIHIVFRNPSSEVMEVLQRSYEALKRPCLVLLDKVLHPKGYPLSEEHFSVLKAISEEYIVHSSDLMKLFPKLKRSSVPEDLYKWGFVDKLLDDSTKRGRKSFKYTRYTCIDGKRWSFEVGG